MKNIQDYIKEAETVCGGPAALADRLGIARTTIADAKAGRRGLPTACCVLIAMLINEEEINVIAANELLTEKNVSRLTIWQSVMLRHAAMLFAFGVVTNVVTPSPAEAAPIHKSATGSMYIMSNRTRQKWAKIKAKIIALVRSNSAAFLRNSCSLGLSKTG